MENRNQKIPLVRYETAFNVHFILQKLKKKEFDAKQTRRYPRSTGDVVAVKKNV